LWCDQGRNGTETGRTIKMNDSKKTTSKKTTTTTTKESDDEEENDGDDHAVNFVFDDSNIETQKSAMNKNTMEILNVSSKQKTTTTIGNGNSSSSQQQQPQKESAMSSPPAAGVAGVVPSSSYNNKINQYWEEAFDSGSMKLDCTVTRVSAAGSASSAAAAVPSSSLHDDTEISKKTSAASSTYYTTQMDRIRKGHAAVSADVSSTTKVGKSQQESFWRGVASSSVGVLMENSSIDHHQEENQREISLPGAFHQDGPEAAARGATNNTSDDESVYYFDHSNTNINAQISDYGGGGGTSSSSTTASNSVMMHGDESVVGVSGLSVGVGGEHDTAVATTTTTTLRTTPPTHVSSAQLIIEARRVDDDDDDDDGDGHGRGTKDIVYARDVKLDNFKRRIVYCVLFAFVMGVTLLIVFVETRSNQEQHDDNQKCTYTDEICCQYDFDDEEQLPIPKSIPVLCYCNQSLLYVEDHVTTEGEKLSSFVQTFSKMSGMNDQKHQQNASGIFDPNSINETTVCNPFNQLYFGIATLPGSALPETNWSKIAPIIFESTIVLAELYIKMEGFAWTNNEGWVENVDICSWYVYHQKSECKIMPLRCYHFIYYSLRRKKRCSHTVLIFLLLDSLSLSFHDNHETLGRYGVDCLFVDTLSGLSLSQNGLKGQLPFLPRTIDNCAQPRFKGQSRYNRVNPI
jgi:hypothetical protein